MLVLLDCTFKIERGSAGREIYPVRANLYGLVAELIVTQAIDEAIQSLQPFLDQMAMAAEKEDLDAYFWPNVAFQDTETTICGNQQVKRILDSLMLRMLQLRYLSLSTPGRLKQSPEDHERLLRAYKEPDSALAVAIKRDIVMRDLANIEKSGWVELNGSTDFDHSSHTNKEMLPNSPNDSF